MVFADVPPSVAMSSTVFPEARPRATRASAGVRSNRDCTNSTGGACGRVDGSQDEYGGAADENVARRQANGNDMRDHHRFGVGIADREGAHAGAARHINGRDRVPQQLVGGSVLQRHAILGPPLDIARERFDQRVGGEDLALLIENQRREAESGERFAGDARPLELQARRQERATSEMGAQFIEFLDDGAFHRSAFGPSCQDRKTRFRPSESESPWRRPIQRQTGAKCHGRSVLDPIRRA